MIPGLHVQLKQAVQLRVDADTLLLVAGRRRVRVPDPDGSLRTLLRGCGESGGTTDELVALAHRSGLSLAALFVPALLERLAGYGWLDYSVLDAGSPVLRAEPTLGAPAQRLEEHEPGAQCVLSRFAYCRRHGDALVVQSGRTSSSVRVLDPRLAMLLAGLARPSDADVLASALALPATVVCTALGLLTSMRIVCRMQGGLPEEEIDVPLRQWEFHDLLFHRGSREDDRNRPLGATYRFLGDIEPLPAVKPTCGGRTLDLPALNDSGGTVTLYDALDARRSIRSHGTRPISVEQLAQVLERSARIRSVRRGEHEEVCSRPFPSGGALHELEVYLVVSRCEGLDAGLYHYRASDAELEQLGNSNALTEALLQNAAYATGTGLIPQVLVVMTARFPRISWKYEAIAYSLMLKHVGCLVQTIYLVATALGLGPCAIGSGNSELFARLLGTSLYEETSVGEITLGTVPSGT